MKMLRLQRRKCLGIPAGQPWTGDGMSWHGDGFEGAAVQMQPPWSAVAQQRAVEYLALTGLDIRRSDRMVNFSKSPTSKIMQTRIVHEEKPDLQSL